MAARGMQCYYTKPLALWQFMGREMGIGFLQALGGIALYALVLWAIFHNLIRTKVFQNAVNARADILVNSSSRNVSS